ncbi:hypothetical protein PIB30_062145 [Stylosanthes scabra]|uniref:Uncharacterized protein n=1 Tax=Stylosanthes scabra TaxID=79078 RepID=A0ABU6SL38_9FABA|nr:hypothetical protein [Stylosanthes scabra]
MGSSHLLRQGPAVPRIQVGEEMKAFQLIGLTRKSTMIGGKPWRTGVTLMRRSSVSQREIRTSSKSEWKDLVEDLCTMHLFLSRKMISAATLTSRALELMMLFRVIGREDTNWANDLTIHIIPEKKLDNAILNTHASAWHKLIMANIDPKTHGTTFDMDHAIMIYVFITEGVVNLPRIMRDILLVRPMKHSRNLLPYPVFISRLADRYQVPVFAGDIFYEVREQEMFCPYGDWKGEQPRIHRGIVTTQAATTGSASRATTTTTSLPSPLYLRSVFIGAFSARGYDSPSIPGCRFLRARAHIF